MSQAPDPASARLNGNPDNPKRQWLLPPTLVRDPYAPESFEGVSILNEIQGDLGLALCQMYRDVILWAGTPQQNRPQLFRSGAAMRRTVLINAASPGASLHRHLEALTLVLRGEPAVDPAVITEAALRVSQWASRHCAARTAVMFAQAASAASPRLASAALEAGRVAADNGGIAVAETWLRRAVGLARRARDWESYVEAQIVLSRVYRTRATSADAAHPAALRAARVARRHGLRLSGARAHHQLSVLALDTNRPRQAEQHARRAYAYYSRQHPEASAMLHLVAESVLAQGKRTAEAIDLLRRALPHRNSPRERFDTLMILMRAGAEVGDKQVLESSWFGALNVIESLGELDDAAEYLFELATEAANALQHKRATDAARRALLIATERQDSNLIRRIGELIQRAHLRTIAPRPMID